MMKGEYSNLFYASVTPNTQELIITFKQSTVEVAQNDNPETNVAVPTRTEIIDISKIVFTAENARQLSKLLNDMLDKFEQLPEEPHNG